MFACLPAFSPLSIRSGSMSRHPFQAWSSFFRSRASIRNVLLLALCATLLIAANAPTTLLSAASADNQPGEARLLRFPALSRESIAFVYAGDLWTVPRSGGQARQLTTDPGLEWLPRYSPDGKWIAFTGKYDGNQD